MTAPVDFNDTEIAFRSRSTAELRKAKMLFQSFSYPSLISFGPKLANLAFGLHLPVTPLIRMTVFDHFCGGVTVDDCDAVVEGLGRFQIRSILDYSVEALGREADFDRTTDELLRVVAKAKAHPLNQFIAFKVTGLARFDLLAKASDPAQRLTAQESAELGKVEERVNRLCRATLEAKRRILIDAEETWIQPAIDRMAVAAMQQFNREEPVVYLTLQMYRVDRLAYLGELHRLGKAGGFRPGIKLVRGAYMEKERAHAAAARAPSPIQPDKAATDRAFDEAQVYCLENIGDLALFSGTHNEESARLVTQLIARQGLARDDRRIELSQLLGMSDNLTYNLAHHGFNVSKYIPYGPVKAVLPYLVRRAEENSSIKGQAGRELQLIERELKRRASAGVKGP